MASRGPILLVVATDSANVNERLVGVGGRGRRFLLVREDGGDVDARYHPDTTTGVVDDNNVTTNNNIRMVFTA